MSLFLGPRIGNLLLLVGGLALAMLMGYVLWLDPARSGDDPRAPGTLDVAVVVPLRDDWHDVRQGILACARDGHVRSVREAPGSMTVTTAGRARPIRFVWQRAQGAVETREVVEGLLRRPTPPAAFIGSVNTSLTVAMAEALAGSGTRDRGGPVLLVPWATATLTQARSRDGRPLPLLGIHPGRTFRFCPNNDRLAELVVGCALSREADGPPSSVLIVEDPADPYSVDLAAGFERAIGRHAPGAEVVKRAETLSSPGLGETPGPVDDHCAARIWQRVLEAPAGRATWLVLPLQGAPIRRIVAALESQEPPGDHPPLRVLCGDGIGLTALRDFTMVGGFSIWCPSWDGLGDVEGRPGMPGEALVPAEVVTALAVALDREEPGPDGLRDALAALDLTADDPAAFGRSLSFEPSGERRSEDLGYVLAVLPGEGRVVAFAPEPGGGWGGPREVPVQPVLALP